MIFMAISEAMLAERPTATDVLDGRTVSYPMKLTAAYVSDVVILCIIKTIEKFSNVIGHHQPDLSRNRTVRASCDSQYVMPVEVDRTRHVRVLLSRISPT